MLFRLSDVSVPKIDVTTKRIYPVELATQLLSKSRMRRILFTAGDGAALVSSVVLFLDGLIYGSLHNQFDQSPISVGGSMDPPYDGLNTSTTIATVILVLGLLGYVFNFYTKYKRFDFAECSKYDYEEIIKLRKAYAHVDEYVNAIRLTGRDWVSNYEYRAIQTYHDASVRAEWKKQAENELSSVKKKALS